MENLIKYEFPAKFVCSNAFIYFVADQFLVKNQQGNVTELIYNIDGDITPELAQRLITAIINVWNSDSVFIIENIQDNTVFVF